MQTSKREKIARVLAIKSLRLRDMVSLSKLNNNEIFSLIEDLIQNSVNDEFRMHYGKKAVKAVLLGLEVVEHLNPSGALPKRTSISLTDIAMYTNPKGFSKILKLVKETPKANNPRLNNKKKKAVKKLSKLIEKDELYLKKVLAFFNCALHNLSKQK